MIAAGLVVATTAGSPLHMEIGNDGGQVVIKVVGESPTAVSAQYELEVSSGASTSSNHSVQRGTVRLQPAVPATLATLKVGNPTGSSLTARLHVTPERGEPYDIRWQSGS